MGLFLVLWFSVIYILFSAAENKWDCADYYWRDYFGTIPADAVPAGEDKYGDEQYIGLVYIRGYEYLPAIILPKEHVAQTTAYGKVFTTSQHVKILCAPYKDAFEWLLLESKNLNKYLDKLLIPGGSQVGEDLLIGRVRENDSYVVGKIFRDYRPNRGIWFPKNGTPGHSLTYEILAYNCEKASHSTLGLEMPRLQMTLF